MKNLEQIRAKNALTSSLDKNFKGTNDGEVVKKVTTMIAENGFIAALAFAKEKGKGHQDVFMAMLDHFKNPAIGVVANNITSIDLLIGYVCDGDSNRLRLVTAEAMAYLSYLRRFAKKGE